MNGEAFPHDAALPQLAIATDGTRMREVFQQHLRPRFGRTYDIRACKLARVRCRRGRRCILQYELHLAEPATSQEWIQPVTGSLYAEPGRARRLYRKQQHSELVSPVPPATLPFEPFAFVPELELFVQVFPYDRSLPALARLVEGLPPDLRSALEERLAPGVWRIEQQATETIRYRAGLGATLRYNLLFRNSATGQTRSQRFYLKAYPDERGAQTFQLLHELGDEAGRISPQLDIVRSVAYSAQWRALLLEEAPGVPLQQLLLAGADPSATRAMACALAALNQSPFVAPRRHTHEDEIANLNRASARLQWARPPLRAEIERIVEAVAAGWVELPAVPVHRDLKTDHVFVDGDRIVLIDLDSFATAHPLLDPALFLARLATLPFQLSVPRDCARVAAQLFAHEYFAHVPHAWRAPLSIYYAGAVLDASQGFFGRQEPDWPATLNALVQEASDALAGKVW